MTTIAGSGDVSIDEFGRAHSRPRAARIRTVSAFAPAGDERRHALPKNQGLRGFGLLHLPPARVQSVPLLAF